LEDVLPQLGEPDILFAESLIGPLDGLGQATIAL
jgi:hypothetical protein